MSLSYSEIKQLLIKRWWWRGAIIGLAVIAVIISSIAIYVGFMGWNGVSRFNSPVSVYTSQPLPSTPYVFYIDGAGAPVTLTLPGDLTAYYGNIYRIYSNTAQEHAVIISDGGATFDGGTKAALFGGNIRDGFEFEVTSGKIANVKISKNIMFS